MTHVSSMVRICEKSLSENRWQILKKKLKRSGYVASTHVSVQCPRGVGYRGGAEVGGGGHASGGVGQATEGGGGCAGGACGWGWRWPREWAKVTGGGIGQVTGCGRWLREGALVGHGTERVASQGVVAAAGALVARVGSDRPQWRRQWRGARPRGRNTRPRRVAACPCIHDTSHAPDAWQFSGAKIHVINF